MAVHEITSQYNESFCLFFQFSQLVSSDLKVLGRSSYTLCSDGQLLIRQVLHPETSKKVQDQNWGREAAWEGSDTIPPGN